MDTISPYQDGRKYVCGMNSEQSFSVWLDHQLKRREWNQREFARRSGLSKSAISEWVRGTQTPDPDSCLKIADALNVDSDMVLVFAGHRPNIEELDPDDPRTDLIELVRRVQWNAEREALIRGQLETMIKVGRGRS